MLLEIEAQRTRGEAHPEARWLATAADALAEANLADLQAGARSPVPALPSLSTVEELVDTLRAVLFPRHFGDAGVDPRALRVFVAVRLERVRALLGEQVRACLAFSCDHPGSPSRCRACDERTSEVARVVIERLPGLRTQLTYDIAAAYEGDPAAKLLDETLLCYPSVTSIIQHRIAHEIHGRAVPLLPRMIAELAHARTGIDIHPGAVIGRSFFVDHGTGVVIGETSIVGDRVRLYQGVTLGAREVARRGAGEGPPRHPIVEDDVVIYAGATLLGRITIGRGSIVGGNVWLTHSVPPGSNVTQARHRQDRFQGGTGI